MREEMLKANLSLPFFESDRAGNMFVLTLLPHHLFNQNDIKWLSRFADCHLTDEEARTLIVVREKGTITNADHRTINAIDTLTASSQLRRLRDLGLLEQKGKGSATYYTPTQTLLSGGLTSPISPLSGGLTSPISPLSGGVPKDLEEAIQKINKRTTPAVVKEVIMQLCAFRPFRPKEIRALLRRSPKHLSEYYLGPMVESGDLELVYPDNPAHPKQAYKTRVKIDRT